MGAKPVACMHSTRPTVQLTVLLIALLTPGFLNPVACHDVGVLMFLHDAFGSPPVLSNWSWAKEPCEPPWFGVKECNQTSGCHTIGDASEDEQNCRILALDLHSLGLGGTISYVLGDSFRLQFLDFSDNAIGGPLPVGVQGISEMVNLQYFNVSHNQLNGSIPYDIGYMYSLQTVDFSYNNFSGALPASLGVLATGGNLTYLDLTGNQFTGPVPRQLASIPTLKLGRVTSTGQIDLGGNSGLCGTGIPGLTPCPPGSSLPGLNTSQPPLPQLSPGVLSPPAPKASVWGEAVLPVQEPSPSANNLSFAPAPSSGNLSLAPAPSPSNLSLAPAPSPSNVSLPPAPPPSNLSLAPAPSPSNLSPAPAPAPAPAITPNTYRSSNLSAPAPAPGISPPTTAGSTTPAGSNTSAASGTPGSALGSPSGAAVDVSWGDISRMWALYLVMSILVLYVDL